MRGTRLFVIYAVVGALYTIGLLLAPGVLLSLYGIAPDPATELVGRFFGVSTAGVTLVAWAARNMKDPGVLRAIALAFFISEALGLIVSLLGVLSGTMNAVGWSAVGLAALFSGAFAYYVFARPTAS